MQISEGTEPRCLRCCALMSGRLGAQRADVLGRNAPLSRAHRADVCTPRDATRPCLGRGAPIPGSLRTWRADAWGAAC